jgi:SAM-dependent methyltransferase
LRYTNEKEVSSDKLAEILQTFDANLDILDVGTGNGDFLAMTLSKLGNSKSFDLALLEPSDDLVRQIAERIKLVDTIRSAAVCPIALKDYATEDTYDVVLASHLFYHITPDDRPEQLQRMVSFLKPGGKLIIVLREKDDAYDFKSKFKPLLYGGDFKALTLGAVLSVMPDSNNFKITRHIVTSELKIPLHNNKHDMESIIEFYLDKPWQQIPEEVKQNALDYIAERNGIFHQKDGIAVIERN